MGGWSLIPPAHDFIEMGYPVTSFVCAIVPGTTRWHALVFSTALLKRHPAFGFQPKTIWVQASPGPTGGTLIKVRRLKHRLTWPAPDTIPAATLLARLLRLFATAVTSVGRFRPHLSGMSKAPALA